MNKKEKAGSIRNSLLNEIKDFKGKIESLDMGLYWTAVNTGKIGLAFTYRSVFLVPHLCPVVRSAGELSKYSPLEIAGLVNSENTLEATFGLAAINSMLPWPDDNSIVQGNAIPLIIDLCRGKTVAMVGYFPFAEEVRAVAKRFFITDKNKNADEGDIAPVEIRDYIKKADIRIITGTTIINHSFDRIMEACPERGLNILFGPSVPPNRVLFDHKVDIIVPVRIENPGLVLQSVREPALVPQMKGLSTWFMTKHEELYSKIQPGNFIEFLFNLDEKYRVRL